MTELELQQAIELAESQKQSIEIHLKELYEQKLRDENTEHTSLIGKYYMTWSTSNPGLTITLYKPIEYYSGNNIYSVDLVVFDESSGVAFDNSVYYTSSFQRFEEITKEKYFLLKENIKRIEKQHDKFLYTVEELKNILDKT